MTISCLEVTAMSTVATIIVSILGCITMLCWTTLSLSMLIDYFKNRK